MKTYAVILAAGEGKRFSAGSSYKTKKQFVSLDDQPLWLKALRPFYAREFIDQIILVGAHSDASEFSQRLHEFDDAKKVIFVEGGERRQDSVFNALRWISQQNGDALPSVGFVFIHDGVRPFVTAALINRLWESRSKEAVIPVVDVTDTVKEVSNNRVNKTLDRRQLRRVQTPQLFSFPRIWPRYQKIQVSDVHVTDDASILEHFGEPVHCVAGDENNIKITYQSDLDIFGDCHQVGQGVDVHQFMGGDHVVLGGIEIPYHKGLKGHSDADVLTHAVCDALLGAVGMADIGTHFPDSDPQYKGISSITLLDKVVDKVKTSGYRISHVDVTVMAEKPTLRPYISEMKIRLSNILGIGTDQLGLKATTSEGIGFIGREEGIAALAVATVRRPEKRPEKRDVQ